jgi:hypothetical protein
MDLALVHLVRGDLEAAREWAAAAHETGALDLEKLRLDADFSALAEDPRFAALLAP